MAKADPAYTAPAQSALGATEEKLAHLTWSGFFLASLLPVTLGNIVGGGLLVAGYRALGEIRFHGPASFLQNTVHGAGAMASLREKQPPSPGRGACAYSSATRYPGTAPSPARIKTVRTPF